MRVQGAALPETQCSILQESGIMSTCDDALIGDRWDYGSEGCGRQQISDQQKDTAYGEGGW